MDGALQGIRVVDTSGTIATSYCAKLYADYGADVINLEPTEGFVTRALPPFLSHTTHSAMHAYLHTNKRSVDAGALTAVQLKALIRSANLILDDGEAHSNHRNPQAIRGSVSWYGETGPYAQFQGSDAQCFALNGMLKNIGPMAGPPLIPTGPQAQIVGGMTAFIATMSQALGAEIGNGTHGAHLNTSIFEAMLCFTDVGVISAYNTGLDTPRMGINRYPPTYPLGVFPCKDGWLGLTVLTPSQWHKFCSLLDLTEMAQVPLFQSAIGRLEAADVLEPMIKEKLLQHSAEDLFYRAQESGVPLARVPTMEELFSVDQFKQRQVFVEATLPSGQALKVPSVPFRLYQSPPKFGGAVAALGAHTAEFSQ